ncbi:MAG TPA: kinase [Croceibacterium sp.]|nr:kinase [Croceibacterium sp.]
MSTAIERLIEAEELPADYRAIVDRHWRSLSEDIAERALDGPLVVGVNGAQGAGKSTLCRFLEVLLIEHNQRAATLSIDDLYLTRAERGRLAREVHPLLATRGVPGTHDPALGRAVIADFRAGRDLALPRFDKSVDDRRPQPERVAGPLDVLLFEGWCLGAAPQAEADLARPVNALEAAEDPDGVWRRYVNDALRGPYAALFAELDMLVMLKVPDFAAVRRNRALQEDKLRARNPDAPGLMDAAALERFLDQDERLTLHMFDEMPARADVLIEIGPDQRPR